MSLDIKTIILSSMLTSLILTGVQFYYLKFHKNYPGAKEWFRGSLCILVCYFFVLTRESLLPSWTSIFIGNSFLLFGVYLRLNASSLFVLKKFVPRFWGFLSIGVLLTWCSVFYWVNDSIAFRSLGLMLIYSAFLFYTALIYFKGHKLFSHGFYIIMLLAHLSLGILTLWRGIYWPLHGTIQLFEPGTFQAVFFVTALLVDIITTQIFIMMNNTQLGKELHDLQLLVPICAYCKSIRRTDGNWQSLEKFLIENGKNSLTHSICPHCKNKFAEEIKNS